MSISLTPEQLDALSPDVLALSPQLQALRKAPAAEEQPAIAPKESRCGACGCLHYATTSLVFEDRTAKLCEVHAKGLRFWAQAEREIE